MVHSMHGHICVMLDCYNYEDALVLAELAHDDAPSDESAYLLATVLYRSGKLHEATHFIELSGTTKSSRLLFLQAQILFETNQPELAERVLLSVMDDASRVRSMRSMDCMLVEFQQKFDVETAPHALLLLGKIALRNKEHELAHATLQLVVQLNPLSWSAYTLLCKLAKQQQEPPTSSELFRLFCKQNLATTPKELAPAEELVVNSPSMLERHRFRRNDVVVVQRKKTRTMVDNCRQNTCSETSQAGKSTAPTLVRLTATELRSRVSPVDAFFIAGEEFATTEEIERDAVRCAGTEDVQKNAASPVTIESGSDIGVQAPGVTSFPAMSTDNVNAVVLTSNTSLLESGSSRQNSSADAVCETSSAAAPDRLTAEPSVVPDDATQHLPIAASVVTAASRSSSRRCAREASERIKSTAQHQKRRQKGSSAINREQPPLFKSPLAIHSTTSSILPLPTPFELSTAEEFTVPPSSTDAAARRADDLSMLGDMPPLVLRRHQEGLPTHIFMPAQSFSQENSDMPAFFAAHEDDDDILDIDRPTDSRPTIRFASSNGGAFNKRGEKRSVSFRTSDVASLPASASSKSSKRVRIQQNTRVETNAVKKIDPFVTPPSQQLISLSSDAAQRSKNEQYAVRTRKYQARKTLWDAIESMQQNYNVAESKKDYILLINYDELNSTSQQLLRLAEHFCLYAQINCELEQYNCRRALSLLRRLPANLSAKALGHFLAGRAHFLQTEYSRAISEFEEMLAHAPHIVTRGVDIYSSALWLDDRKQQLSVLAKFMRAHYPSAPETCVVLANTFSLANKDHTSAIRMLRRAVQLRPDYYYAHYLLGQEYNTRQQQPDDEAKALQCFHLAVKLDSFNYLAYFGIACVHSKYEEDDDDSDDDEQQHQRQAYVALKQAYEICPSNPVLMVHLALASQKLFSKNSSAMQQNEALFLLRRAARVYPQNHLVKFQLAQMLFSRHLYDEAVEQLLKLTDLLPREPFVYLLLGKVYESRPETQHKALMCFSRACDLDPKGQANNSFLKEAFDKIHAVA